MVKQTILMPHLYIARIKILYKNKENVCAFLFVFFKKIVMYYINIYLSLLQVLSDVRTAVHWYEHMSAGRCSINACYYKFHYPNSFTIHKISCIWKHSSFVTFNIGFFPSFFRLFCKISVKGWVTELKVKTAKKLRKFLSIEISTFEYKL